MATMVFAGLDDPEKITDDEWFALAQADPAGYATYAPAFLETELPKAAYDRWWDKSRPDKRHRYLAGPMTFLSVMNWPSGSRAPYFERMRGTWRRQQFQFFLLAHYQRAALLILEDGIAYLAAQIDNPPSKKNRKQLARKIEQLQGDIAKFSSGRWFPEVTPQIQGQELYDLLRKHIGLETLYRSVVEDKALLGSWLQATETVERDRSWDRINNLYLPAILAITAMGASIVTEPLKNFFLCLIGGAGPYGELQSAGAGMLVFASFIVIFFVFWRFARLFGDKR
jgi:hypothetical protein